MGKELDNTLEYYEAHAEEYAISTIHANMDSTYQRFLKYLPNRGKLLDLGCGSGRDSAFFIKEGFEVTAVDGSSKMCKLAEKAAGIPVVCKTFEQIDYKDEFDAVWACASLLHAPKKDMKDILIKISHALKENGVFYVSYKVGNSERDTDEGKHYSDYEEADIVSLFHETNLALVEFWESGDTLKRADLWLNIIARKIHRSENV